MKNGIDYMSHVRNANVEHYESLSPLEHAAMFVTNKIGSMGFFFIVLIWTLLWIIWNSYAPHEMRFDPYPGFILWLFISNVLQLVLLPLIMVGQNLQSRHAEARAEADFEVNIQAEKEIQLLLASMQKQSNVMLEILRRLDETSGVR